MSSQDLDKYSGLQRILAASFYSYQTYAYSYDGHCTFAMP